MQRQRPETRRRGKGQVQRHVLQAVRSVDAVWYAVSVTEVRAEMGRIEDVVLPVELAQEYGYELFDAGSRRELADDGLVLGKVGR